MRGQVFVEEFPLNHPFVTVWLIQFQNKCKEALYRTGNNTKHSEELIAHSRTVYLSNKAFKVNVPSIEKTKTQKQKTQKNKKSYCFCFLSSFEKEEKRALVCYYRDIVMIPASYVDWKYA